VITKRKTPSILLNAVKSRRLAGEGLPTLRTFIEREPNDNKNDNGAETTTT
jgi:hypothetical protein